MFNGRLHSKRAALVVQASLLLAGALGFSVAVGRAGQGPPNPAALINSVKGKVTQASSPAVQNPSPSKAGQLSTATAPAGSKEKVQAPVAPTPALKDKSLLQAASKLAKKAREKAGTEYVKTPAPSLLSSAAGRRDPFKASVIPSAASHTPAGPSPGALAAGARGLVISEIRLEGVVRQEPANNMIAVVTNTTKRAYFLRVNDTVYNGVVSRITPEAVYFNENTLDSSGRLAAHEVEIKLGSAPGEGR